MTVDFPAELKVYVISVRSFHDRHCHIQELSDRFGFQFEYVFDYDADDLKDADWKLFGRSMSPQAASTVLKHIECQRRLLNSDSEYALIFEDDVIPLNGFNTRIKKVMAQVDALEPGFLVFLGGVDNKIDRRFAYSKKDKLISHPMSTAEAYIIDKAGSQLRLNWLEANLITMPADHQLRWMDEMLSIPQYWASFPLVTQGSISGKFPTTLDSSRGKHSLIFLRLKFEWNRLRRQIIPRFIVRIQKIFQ
jgi:hypothetical protein